MEQLLNSLEFDDNRASYEQIEAVATVQGDSLVHNWERVLPLKGDTAQAQLVAEALFVG